MHVSACLSIVTMETQVLYSGCVFQSSTWRCSGGRGMASISAVKSDDLIDNPVKITISGLRSGQKITCLATVEENKMRFGSHAHFLANNQGEVNLENDISVGGSYTGLDGMGLFWSMTQTPGQRSGLRLAKKDVTTPLAVNLSVLDDHWSADEVYQHQSLEPLTRITVNRWYLGKDVTRSEIRHGNIRGTLFTPTGNGPFKGVIDMFGTAGGIMEFRAALLASRGFIVLCLPYFNYQDLTKSLMHVDFSYFLEAVDWFSNLPNVQSEGIGVVGVSKGGEIGLWMAVHCPQIQSSKAKVLVLFGDDDQMNPTEPQYEYLDWLPESKRADVELCIYPGTGHLIEPPYIPFCRASFHILFRDSVVWGGEAKAHSHSQVLAWNKLLAFLHQNVGQSEQRTNNVTSRL